VLLKWIVCEVANESRTAFSAAQSQWDQLRGVDGFSGQVGGWDARESAESLRSACIVGLWRDSDAYRNFMSNVHDPLVEASGQAATYASATTALFDVQFDIPGSLPDLSAAMNRCEFLRVADCRLLPGREDHFRQVQSDIWNPGMAAADGMAAGAFSRSRRDGNRFLVTTLWESEAAHAAYVRGAFPRLRERAEVESDVANLLGHRVVLEPDWRVCSVT
jgi:heme-degrading monooxygenase HmoA